MILEAADGLSGLDLYRRSQRIDRMVLELALSGRSGLALLVDLIPLSSRPNVAVMYSLNSDMKECGSYRSELAGILVC